MKIGFIFNQSAIIGGGEISFIELCAAFTASDLDPIAIVPGSGEIEERLTALKIPAVHTEFPHLTPFSLPAWFKRVRMLAKTFSELGLDLIHVNGARSMLYAGPAARHAGIPCIWHNRVLHRDRLLDRFRGRYANAVIANSHAVAATLARMRITNVTVVYNGFDLDAIRRQTPLDLHREFQIAHGVPVILAVGRLSQWKGFDDLIESCVILEKKGVPFFCMIVGKSLPEERRYVAALLGHQKKCGLSNVHFTGWRNDVNAIMKSATLLAVPSHGEPFGRIIVEAWACGLPVVATNAGGPAELIKNGEDGLLVEMKDPRALAAAIEDLLAHPEKRAALSRAGTIRANDFSLERHKEMVASIYKRLVHPT
jgi:glycosyltransferase involved in cell wall biosynthesis